MNKNNGMKDRVSAFGCWCEMPKMIRDNFPHDVEDYSDCFSRCKEHTEEFCIQRNRNGAKREKQ